jgi:hypothetical protein
MADLFRVVRALIWSTTFIMLDGSGKDFERVWLLLVHTVLRLQQIVRCTDRTISGRSRRAPSSWAVWRARRARCSTCLPRATIRGASACVRSSAVLRTGELSPRRARRSIAICHSSTCRSWRGGTARGRQRSAGRHHGETAGLASQSRGRVALVDGRVLCRSHAPRRSTLH